MHILVTNDDGFRSDGLRVMAEVASRFGSTTVVAPDRDCSGISQALTLNRPLRLARRPDPSEHELIGGTPGDCVYVGLHRLLADRPVGLVLSGINPGPNLSWDVLYSGTTGAARVAVLQGVPAVAVSLLPAPEGYPFGDVASWVERIVRRVVAQPLPPRVFLNVNVPNPHTTPVRGIRVAGLGQRSYSREIEVRTDPRGSEYMWIGGREVHMPDIPGSDCNAVKDGFVSVTPVGCDPTAHELLGSMNHWNEQD